MATKTTLEKSLEMLRRANSELLQKPKTNEVVKRIAANNSLILDFEYRLENNIVN